ncbi:putative ribonuclease H-like domain-containing protein, partial [Tanacetum coccineum]
RCGDAPIDLVGNDESKKMQKYILKQQFEGFSVSNSEGLHKGYDRFQSLLSQLGIHGVGHFARECRIKGNQDNRRMDAWNSGTKDGARTGKKDGFLKHCSESDTEVTSCSNECKESYAKFKKLYDVQREQLSDASIEIKAYTLGLKKVEAQLVAHQQGQLWYEQKIKFMKIDLDDKTDVLTYHKKLLAEAQKEKEDLKAKVEKWHNSSKNLSKLLNTQMSANDKFGLGYGDHRYDGILSYENEVLQSVFMNKESELEKQPLYDRFVTAGGMHVVPPPMTGNYMPSGPDIEIVKIVNTARASGTKNVSTARHSFNRQAVLTSTAMKVNSVKHIVNRARPENVFQKTHSPSSRPFKNTIVLRTNLSKQKVNTAKDYPHRALKNKGIVDSGCSRHMTGNKAYLAKFQDFNGGPVAFGGSKDYITGKEFKNKDVIELCGSKGIKREYSNARTPQQNGVAERKNMTLIEAARTMLYELFLTLTLFGSENQLTNMQRGPQEANHKAEDEKSKRVGPREEEQVFLDELERLKRQEKDANEAAEAFRNEYAQATENLLIQAGAANASSTNLVNTLSTPAKASSTNLVHTDKPPQRRIIIRTFQHFYLLVLVPQNEPKKISEALEDESWVDAMQEELLQFKIQKVWILVDLPFGKKAIGTKWVLSNHSDLFAIALLGLHSFKWMFKKCLLYGKCMGGIWSHIPPRFSSFVDPKYPKKLYKVLKALYDLHQAPRAWYATLSTFLLNNGYRRGTIDKTLFIKKDNKDIMLVQVYVDDIIFGSTKKSWCDEFEALMKSRFQMSSIGELTFFLGLQVKQKEDGIFISQDKYVAEILKKFDFASVKTASTPIETQKPFVKDEEAADVDVHLYRSMIGSLMYLTTSRPDIMFAVCACSRFQVTLKTSYLHAVKRIFRYLKGKTKLGLWYHRVSSFDLEAYSDNDYAGANLDRKSTTRGCQFLGRRLISWQCKKQTIVATSTIEAEYVAAANCCGQVLWIQNQMDAYEKKLIQVLKIHTDDNVADLLTEAFDVSIFNFLIVNIGMLNQ